MIKKAKFIRLQIYEIYFDNANEIPKNKVFDFLTLHAKNICIFFPHHLNGVKMICI
jgi:hypothetical protein